VPFPVLLRNLAPVDRAKLSETVNAIEFGYRQQVDTYLSLDLTAFHNYYSRLSAARLGPQQIVFQPFPYVVQNVIPANTLQGSTWGLELAVDWRPQRTWRVQGVYSYLKADITPSVPGDAVEAGAATRLTNSAPQHQLLVRSSHSLGNGREFDARVRYVSAIQADASGVPSVDAYTSLDLRYAWRPLPKLTLSLTAENLLNERHAEFVPDLLPSQLLVVPRSVNFKALWQF
jgi:iron complex outermembrane receptor protein